MLSLTEQLAQNPVFACLDEPDRTQLARQAIRKQYRKGEWIAHHGDDWPYLFLVGDGVVHGLKESSEGRSLPKAFNQVYDFLGRHRPWCLCSRAQLRNRRRRTQTLFTYQFGLSDPSTIIYLKNRQTSCGTHRFSEPLKAGQVSIMCRTDSLPRAPVLFDVSGGRNGRPESAGCTSADKFEFVFRRGPILV